MNTDVILNRVKDLFTSYPGAQVDVAGDDTHLMAVITVPGEVIFTLSAEKRDNRPKNAVIANLTVKMQQVATRRAADLVEWGERVSRVCHYADVIDRIVKQNADCHEPMVSFRVTTQEILDPQGWIQ